MNKFFACLVLTAAALLAGCAVNNNHLSSRDFAARLQDDGIKVDAVRDLRPDPFRANSGTGIMVGGSEIGVYKYDTSSKLQKKRLDSIAESKKLFIIGQPYPVVVHGSFVFFGLDKNPLKRKILKSIAKFN